MKQTQQIEDHNDLLTEYAFDPRLVEEGFSQDKFKHLNKNLSLTHVNKNQAVRVQQLLRCVQILVEYNETTYYVEETVRQRVKTKEAVTDDDGNILEPARYDTITQTGYVQVNESQAQRYQKAGENVETETTNQYQPAINTFLGEVYSITSLASGTGANLLRQLMTERVEQKQTIREQQEPRRSFFSSKKDKAPSYE